MKTTHKRLKPVTGVTAAALAIALVAASCATGRDSEQAAAAMVINGRIVQGIVKDLPVAPENQRVDIKAPKFSNPRQITNPLFPISELRSALLMGNVDGHQFRVETTLLASTKTINFNGQKFEALVSQYVAYLDGRIEEVALDFYAQADDGAVWYLGEDVFNYRDGEVADQEGTWLAGKDGPPAMIMPAQPKVGDVFRPENIPNVVFEEVLVNQVGVPVEGPRGPVSGAITTEELHMDGKRENKTFAPGYGEFSTGIGGDLEAMALAIPADALGDAVPEDLDSLLSGAETVFDAAGTEDWNLATLALDKMTSAWSRFRSAGVPPLLATQMDRALAALTGDRLSPAARAHDAAGARRAAIDTTLSGLDLLLRYQPIVEIDLARFESWLKQVVSDASADDAGGVKGDASTLEWIRARFSHTLDSSKAKDIAAQLTNLRKAADKEDLEAASKIASSMLRAVDDLEPSK